MRTPHRFFIRLRRRPRVYPWMNAKKTTVAVTATADVAGKNTQADKPCEVKHEKYLAKQGNKEVPPRYAGWGSIFFLFSFAVFLIRAEFLWAEASQQENIPSASADISAPASAVSQENKTDPSGIQPPAEKPDSQRPSMVWPALDQQGDLAVEQASPESQPAKIVKAIEIRGNKTVGVATILSKIKTRVGSEYLQNVISDDLKRLYNTGFFSDVSTDREDYEGGFRIIIYLVEKPIVEKITFTKTRYLNMRTITAKIQTKEGKFLDNKALKDDVETIKDLYAQKGLTTVTVEAEKDIDKTTNKAKLHFVINEGYRVKIKKINFHGNTSYPSKRLIKIIKSRPAWLFASGYLKEDILKEDLERIKSFYEREGFIDASASYTLHYGAQGALMVDIDIAEGKKYYVGEITVENNKIVTKDEILGIMNEIKKGKPFSHEKLDVDSANIRTLYFDKGYIFADVKQTTSLNPGTGNIDIFLSVQEGGLAYVNKIKIQGNARTRDIVIRRELRINPGEQFDGEKLRRSKERLRNLQFFEDINYDIEDTDIPNKKDLVVQVKEAKTGTFSFGGGYSTIDQLVGFVEVEQRNFDFTSWPTFTGGGQNLTLHAETGSVRNNTRLSFTEPWIFDYPISGGFDAYRTIRLRESNVGYGYDEKRIGGDIRFGKELTEYLSASTAYKFESTTISNLDTGATADLVSELGTNAVSSINFGLAWDGRDSRLSPTKGLFLSGSTDVAGGIFGGDKDFYRLQGKGSYYIPLVFNSVLEFRLQSGFVDAYGDSTTVPIFERFFAGGAYTIRGYDERRVGPIDPVTEDPLGGEGMLVGNIEYTVALIEFIKVAAFFDSGSVWSRIEDFGSGGYKSGTGLGLRIKTPIGPVNLDYGYPLSSQAGEDKRSGKFYFSVSRGF